MLGTEVADEQVPATKEAMAQDAHLGMCQTTAAVAAPPLSAHADEIESESMPPPVPRRHPPIFNDTQNASEDKGASRSLTLLAFMLGDLHMHPSNFLTLLPQMQCTIICLLDLPAG